MKARAAALQRQRAVRKDRAEMEVVEKIAVAAMARPVREPMGERSLVMVASQPRAMRVRTRVRMMVAMRMGRTPVESPRKEKGPMTMQQETMLGARAERARNPRARQRRLQCSALTPRVRARTLLLGMRKRHLGRCRV